MSPSISASPHAAFGTPFQVPAFVPTQQLNIPNVLFPSAATSPAMGNETSLKSQKSSEVRTLMLVFSFNRGVTLLIQVFLFRRLRSRYRLARVLLLSPQRLVTQHEVLEMSLLPLRKCHRSLQVGMLLLLRKLRPLHLIQMIMNRCLLMQLTLLHRILDILRRRQVLMRLCELGLRRFMSFVGKLRKIYTETCTRFNLHCSSVMGSIYFRYS